MKIKRGTKLALTRETLERLGDHASEVGGAQTYSQPVGVCTTRCTFSCGIPCQD